MANIAQQWFEEGLNKGRIEDSKNMLRYGMEIELISKITPLPMEKMKELSDELG